MKVCSKCKVELALDKYYKNRSLPDGHGHMCKECVKADNKMRYEIKHGIKKQETYICPICEQEHPLIVRYWSKRGSKLYLGKCKQCLNERQVLLRTRKREAKARIEMEKEFARAEEIQKIYLRTLKEGRDEDKLLGLQLSDVKLKIGNTYAIKEPGIITEKNSKTFKGKLIQICDRHLVFKCKGGWCESFLKVDLLLEHEYQEVM